MFDWEQRLNWHQVRSHILGHTIIGIGEYFDANSAMSYKVFIFYNNYNNKFINAAVPEKEIFSCLEKAKSYSDKILNEYGFITVPHHMKVLL